MPMDHSERRHWVVRVLCWCAPALLLLLTAGRPPPTRVYGTDGRLIYVWYSRPYLRAVEPAPLLFKHERANPNQFPPAEPVTVSAAPPSPNAGRSGSTRRRDHAPAPAGAKPEKSVAVPPPAPIEPRRDPQAPAAKPKSKAKPRPVSPAAKTPEPLLLDESDRQPREDQVLPYFQFPDGGGAREGRALPEPPLPHSSATYRQQ